MKQHMITVLFAKIVSMAKHANVNNIFDSQLRLNLGYTVLNQFRQQPGLNMDPSSLCDSKVWEPLLGIQNGSFNGIIKPESRIVSEQCSMFLVVYGGQTCSCVKCCVRMTGLGCTLWMVVWVIFPSHHGLAFRARSVPKRLGSALACPRNESLTLQAFNASAGHGHGHAMAL